MTESDETLQNPAFRKRLVLDYIQEETKRLKDGNPFLDIVGVLFTAAILLVVAAVCAAGARSAFGLESLEVVIVFVACATVFGLVYAAAELCETLGRINSGLYKIFLGTANFRD